MTARHLLRRHQLTLPDGSSQGSSPAEGEAEVTRLSDQVRGKGGEGGREGGREGGEGGREGWREGGEGGRGEGGREGGYEGEGGRREGVRDVRVINLSDLPSPLSSCTSCPLAWENWRRSKKAVRAIG